jgi:hypothetical protein
MSIRTIRHDEPLSAIRDELVYTRARLRKNAHASEHVPAIQPLLDRWDKVNQGQLHCWDAEVEAQAGVDEQDDALDDVVEEIDVEIRRASPDERAAPRYKRYFQKPPSTIVRLGLASELDRVRSWPASLQGEQEQELKELGSRLQGLVAGGGTALGERASAIAATADHRVREIISFVDDANATRLSLYGALVTLASRLGLPKDWPNRFFRRSTRSARSAAPARPAEPPPA